LEPITEALRAASFSSEPATRMAGPTTINVTIATVAAGERLTDCTDLLIRESRGTNSTPSVTDQTIPGRNGIARK
jgi:hypothetical protein